jgi:hypothetical protein
MHTVRCVKEVIEIRRNLVVGLIVTQLVKKFSALYGTRWFIAVYKGLPQSLS